MSIHTFTCGPFETNCYVVADDATDRAIVIDTPPSSRAPISAYLRERNLSPEAIVLTHGHWDHFADAAPLRKDWGAPILCHKMDEDWITDPRSFVFPPPYPIPAASADRHLRAGDTVEAGNLAFRVLHVPGHSRGHIALYEERLGALFSGDLLFYGSIGRTDFPGGDYDTIMHSIETLVLTLPDGVAVYSGHGPATTVGFERSHNPFILEYLETK